MVCGGLVLWVEVWGLCGFCFVEEVTEDGWDFAADGAEGVAECAELGVEEGFGEG